MRRWPLTWFRDSVFDATTVEEIIAFVSGDVCAATAAWEQTLSSHDGFETPGARAVNPCWSD